MRSITVLFGIAISTISFSFAPPPATEEEDEGEEHAEIEVVGRLSSVPEAAKYVVFAQTRPCDLDALEDARPVGIDSLVPANTDKVFAFEAVLDDDEHAYVCAVAFDPDRRVVAFGGSGRRPLAIERAPGEEYGRAHGVDVPLAAVDPPLAIDNRALLHHGG